MGLLHRRIYRERRRLSIFLLLSALSGYLFFIGDNRMIATIPLPFLAGVGFAVVLGAVALITCLLLPDYRFALEAIGLTLLIYAVMSAYFPILSIEHAPLPLLNMILFMIGAQVMYHLMYGNWSEKLLISALHVDRATALSPLDRELLWLALYPDPKTVEYYHDETVAQMEHVEGQLDTLRLLNRFRNGLFMERVLQFDQVKPGWSFRYSYEILGAEPTEPAEKPRRYTVALAPHGDDMTAVHIRWERPDYPMRKALMHWVDDWAGRNLDQMIRRAEARANA